MSEQLQQRAEAIRQALRERPEQGADLLMDFARRFAAQPNIEDDIILLKIELSDTADAEARAVIVQRLESLADAIVGNHDPAVLQAVLEKEAALELSLRQQLPSHDLVLEARQLKKSYPSTRFALEAESLELRLGEITALVGENATGKTTLFRILAGELALDQGTLRFPLFDPHGRQSWAELKEQIAYVPQELPAWHGALRDNLRYEAALRGLRGLENRAAVNYIVQRLGLGLHLDKSWAQLSGGYKLRFALARALVWRPRLLLLDEPLAFLDVKTQLVVLTDLQNLARSLRHPIAVLISSQHLFEAEAIADHLLFMREGQLENLGSKAMLGANRQLNVFELGCVSSYSELQRLLEHFPHHNIWSDGMHWFVATPTSVSGFQLQQHLNERGLTVGYYRDLSRSVKTLFYEDYL